MNNGLAYGIPKNVNGIKEAVLKYRFSIDASNDLIMSLEKVNFSIGKKCKAKLIFRENIEGTILPLLTQLIKEKNITIYAKDNNCVDLYKISISGILTDKTEMRFGYDYATNEIVRYVVKIECSSINNLPL